MSINSLYIDSEGEVRASLEAFPPGEIPGEIDLANTAASLRRLVLDLTVLTKSPHLACCFSCLDILTALYFEVLPRSFPSSQVVFSKGHACLALYTSLTCSGRMPKEILLGYGIDGGTLEHHPRRAPEWGIEVTAGSLGHGSSIAAGLTKGKLLDRASGRIFAIVSDGELQEGMSWEAFNFAAHHQLRNLTVVVDYNKMQALGHVKDILGLEPLADKFRAFGWDPIQVDGHSYSELVPALTGESDIPRVVIAHTVKGNGVSFFENNILWHYRCPDAVEYKAAREELI